MRLFRVILVIMAILSLVAATDGMIALGVILFLVPGLILIAAPNVLLYGGLLYGALAFALTAGNWRTRLALSVGITLAGVLIVGVAVPLLAGRADSPIIAGLRAGDREPLDLTTPIRQVALVMATTDKSTCDSLCQRLLYNKSVERVLVPSGRLLPTENPTGAKATAYRIENRPACAPVTVPPATIYQTTHDARGGTSSKPVDIAAITKMRIAAGECLVVESASLDEAELTIVEGKVKNGNEPKYRPLSLSLDTVEARRLVVLVRHGSALQKIFQRTHVRWAPIAVPFHFDGLTYLTLALGRTHREEGAYDLETFIAQDLKLDVGVPQAVTPDQERQMVLAALQAERPNAGLALVSGYLFRLSQRTSIPAADFEVLRLIAADSRIQAQDLRQFPSYRLGPEAEVLARPLAQRLLAADPRKDSEYLHVAARVIWEMPPGSMASAREELTALARDPTRRGVASAAVGRLADSGPSSAPLLIEIFAASTRDLPKDFNEREVIFHAATGAAQGLCLLGADAAAVRPYAQAVIREAVAKGTPHSTLARIAALLLAHIGFAADINDAFSGAGNIPPDLSSEISRSLKERACRL
jgi:hypothetical protein